VSEFYRSTICKSRTIRRCESCNKIIEAGTQHEYVATKYDGDFGTFRRHLDCLEYERHLNDINGMRGEEYSWLHEHVSEGGKSVLHDAPAAVKLRFGVEP